MAKNKVKKFIVFECGCKMNFDKTELAPYSMIKALREEGITISQNTKICFKHKTMAKRRYTICLECGKEIPVTGRAGFKHRCPDKCQVEYESQKQIRERGKGIKRGTYCKLIHGCIKNKNTTHDQKPCWNCTVFDPVYFDHDPKKIFKKNYDYLRG